MSEDPGVLADTESQLNTGERVRAMTDNEADDERDGQEEQENVVRAEELFAGKREVWIELDGVRYRLRITRRGKLILQK
jgi:hemin uptake protein HemP